MWETEQCFTFIPWYHPEDIHVLEPCSPTGNQNLESTLIITWLYLFSNIMLNQQEASVNFDPVTLQLSERANVLPLDGIRQCTNAFWVSHLPYSITIKNVFMCSGKIMKDHLRFQTYNSNGVSGDQPNRATLVTVWICFLPLNHYISSLLLVSRCLTTAWCLLWLWWHGQPKVSQARCHICFIPAHQSSTPRLFIMFLLISIMKGLIMLMRRPSGLVLSVGDTAVGLRGKSCAKCVT